MDYKRFAILGSNSFAGRCLIDRLITDGNEILGISRSEANPHILLPKGMLFQNSHQYKFFQGDLNINFEDITYQLNKFKPQVIVDFSGQGMVAESWQYPEQWYQTNIVSKVKLHNFLKDASWLYKLIRISTPEVYGSQESEIAETNLYKPSTPYAVSHAAIDLSLKAFFDQYGFPVIFTRFANFYGPYQQLYRIIPRAIIYSLLGKKLQLHGGGASIRAFIYSTDISDAICKTINHGKLGECYHFSSQKFMSIRSVIEIICNELDVNFSDLVEITADRPGKDHAYLMNSEKARHDLGWADSMSFENGIHETVKWVRNSLEEIKRLPLDYVHKK